MSAGLELIHTPSSQCLSELLDEGEAEVAEVSGVLRVVKLQVLSTLHISAPCPCDPL